MIDYTPQLLIAIFTALIILAIHSKSKPDSKQFRKNLKTPIYTLATTITIILTLNIIEKRIDYTALIFTIIAITAPIAALIYSKHKSKKQELQTHAKEHP